MLSEIPGDVVTSKILDHINPVSSLEFARRIIKIIKSDSGEDSIERSLKNVADPETESIWTIEVKQDYIRLWCNNKLSLYREYRNISKDCENRMKMEPVKILLSGYYDTGTTDYQAAPGNDCLIVITKYLSSNI